MGMINFYRRNIPHAAEYQRRLQNIIHSNNKNDDTPLIWNPDAISAFGEFFLSKLSKAETKWSTYDYELLVVFSAIQHFHSSLEASEFAVLTDHKPLVHKFMSQSEKVSPRVMYNNWISSASSLLTYTMCQGQKIYQPTFYRESIQSQVKLVLNT